MATSIKSIELSNDYVHNAFMTTENPFLLWMHNVHIKCQKLIKWILWKKRFSHQKYTDKLVYVEKLLKLSEKVME